jgi:hypothetical protein
MYYGVAASGSSVSDVVVNFTDLTSQTFLQIQILDWYGGTASVTNIGRVNISTGAVDVCSATGPNFYEAKFTLSASNATKTVSSVTFNKTSGTGYLGFLL